MKPIVFTGPTLPPELAAEYLDAEYRPPAAIGDVYRAAIARPWAIGIIDGFFESLPSVWHKEVLWAMAQGIHVFGGSSMGALRAAELADFGMIGVGDIFQAYRDGAIEDDDEVAVLHGPAELGYPQLCEAMVNIRATLRQAVAAGIIAGDSAASLAAIGKRLFYKERGYDRLLALAGDAGLPAAEMARLKAWLPEHQINQKRLDAIALLKAMAKARETAAPKQVDYVFEHTAAWDAVERAFGEASPEAVAPAAADDDLLDELRLDDATHRALRREVLRRVLVGHEVARRGFQATAADLAQSLRRFREEQGIRDPDELDAWLAERALSREDFLKLMENDAHHASLEATLQADIDAGLLDQMRANGIYTQLAARARDKNRRLGDMAAAETAMADLGLSEGDLIAWFARECLGDEKLDDTQACMGRLGYRDKGAFLRALIREYHYRRQPGP